MAGFIKRKVKSLTLGEKMKKIRENAGVSLAEIASHTKIKKDYLRKIEQGNYDDLPFDVYVKGFLRSYAKYLGLNSKKIVSQFEKEVGVRKNVKKYQDREKKGFDFKFPSITITPKIASLLFSSLLVTIGALYFYFEVDHFSKEPNLVIDSPKVNTTLKSSSVKVSGSTDFENKIVINSQPVYVDSTGKFSEEIGLQKGPNQIVIKASNKFEKSTERIINVVADYEVEILGKQAKEEEEQENLDFLVEIESRENSVWVTLKIDEGEPRRANLFPDSSIKIRVVDQVQIETGNASDTYVRIDEQDFFPIDKETSGFKKIVLNKREN